MAKLSIAIPTHDMQDKANLFQRCLDSLWNQSFQDFEIIVTDNSDDDVIEEICNFYRTGIKYYKNPVKGMAQNTNEAIRKSTGSLIKILYMDDFMAHDDALKEIWDNFDGWWLVTGCEHSYGKERYDAHVPKYSLDIATGNNTIGSPSVLTIKNDHPLMFDEEMTWLLDCDYYKRMYSSHGAPTILKDINVVIGIHEGQATMTLSDDVKAREYEYLQHKYA